MAFVSKSSWSTHFAVVRICRTRPIPPPSHSSSSYTFSFIAFCPALGHVVIFQPDFQSLFLVDSHSFSVEVTCKLIGMCRLCVCGTCARGLEFARVRVCVVPMEPPGLVHERTRGALNADTATVRCAVTLQTQAAPRISFLSTTGLPHPNLRLLSQDNADRKQKVFLLV